MKRVMPLLVLLLLAMPANVLSGSAFSPKHSGLDEPGRTHRMPMPSYTDAYGYGLTDKMPEERKQRARPRPGAYGNTNRTQNPANNSLPDAPADKGRPLWGFQ